MEQKQVETKQSNVTTLEDIEKKVDSSDMETKSS
jgi:hypothetical protein